MTKFGGRVSSLLTNYDITFWLLLQSALDSGLNQELTAKPCTAVPFRSVSIRPVSDQVSQTLAALNLVLVGSKIEDDEQDGERWKARAGRFLFGRDVAKARRYLLKSGYNLDHVFDLPQAQYQAERASRPTLSSLSEPTGVALGQVFAVIAVLQEKDDLVVPLTELGASLGRFLYVWDALDDLKSDQQSDSFNAIARVFKKSEHKPQVREFLTLELGRVQAALKAMALGPESKLCFELTRSLQQQVAEKLGVVKSESCCQVRDINPARGSSVLARRRLDRAGFCDCDCCGDGCCGDGCCSGEIGCCECGSCCDCNICDCNPCDRGDDACCECSVCDCCCSASICDSTGNRADELCCPELLCCWCDDASPYSTRDSSGRKLSLSQYFKMAKASKDMGATDRGPSQRLCPGCRCSMISLSVGETVLDECRNCGGVWCDDQEIDTLARLVRIPHNLVNRYPLEETLTKCLPGERNCPVCDQERLVVVPYLGVPIEMCRRCHGFWLEHGRLKKVLHAKKSPKRLLSAHRKDWRCPYCDCVSKGGDVCEGCGAPRPKSGFTGKLA